MRKLLIAIAIFGCSAEEAPPSDASGLAPLAVQGGTYLTHEAGNAGTFLTSPGGHALSPAPASEGQRLASVSLSPCTSVALTTPHTGFTATAGVPIPLVATASCGDSTPEFMYWHKLAEDANWTQSGVYVASGDTFTPPTPGTWCVSVVTRALGSTASYEKRSAAVCGTVATETQPHITQTRMIPMVGGLQAASATGFSITLPSAQATLVTPIDGRVGESIASIRARLQDNSVGHTTMIVALASTSDSNNSFNVIAVSNPSLGNGADQTVGITFPAIQLQPLTQYFAIVAAITGNAPTLVYRIEADFL